MKTGTTMAGACKEEAGAKLTLGSISSLSTFRSFKVRPMLNTESLTKVDSVLNEHPPPPFGFRDARVLATITLGGRHRASHQPRNALYPVSLFKRHCCIKMSLFLLKGHPFCNCVLARY